MRQVVVVAWEEQADEARAMAEALDAWFSSRGEGRVTWRHAGDMDAEVLMETRAAVIIPGDRVNGVLPLLAALESVSVPVVALLPDGVKNSTFEFAETIREPRDIPIDELGSVLRGVLHRQGEVSRLHHEIALAHRYKCGISDEMARMHEELQLAAMVQREFLPRRMPKLYGVECAALWRPAHYVSGDLYDVVRLDEDHIGVFIADAAGHGVPAALMSMIICRSIVTKTTGADSYRIIPPSEVMENLNADLTHRTQQTNRFATAVYAVINCRDRVMTLAGAGHPPPLVLRAGCDPQPLETTGGLLGVFEDETYGEIEVNLQCGDRVLFFSDGFEQAFPRADSDDYERRLPNTQYLDEFERLLFCADAPSMVDRMKTRLDDQCGSLHQIDDLTLICVHAQTLAQPTLSEDAAGAQAPTSAPDAPAS